VARFLLTSLPERVALAIGACLGACAGSVLRIRRRVVDENLLRAFPDRDDPWRRRVAKASYRHLGREAVATFRFARESAADVVARTEVHGFDRLQRAIEGGAGAIVVTGHLGNWEMGGSALVARGIPVDAVAVRQRNRLFDAELLESRARLGMRVIPRAAAARDVFESLRRGRCPALVADQDAGRRGLFVDFFGVPASTARGPAVFALRSGAPIFLGVALAVPGKRHRYRIELQEVAFEPEGDARRDVERLTVAHTTLLEHWVRAAPEQYFWQHRRWKRSPEGGRSDRPG
jgi:KDO2-lipid IV(A) lauroyltransferase